LGIRRRREGSVTKEGRLRGLAFRFGPCALLALVRITLALCSPLSTAAAGPVAPPPKLLWKTYPLAPRPTTPRAKISDRTRPGQRAAAPQVGSAAGPSLALILSLSFAAILFGIAALPQAAFPNPRVADAVVRRRALVAAAGAALLLAAVVVAVT
jgi:hypothetical protein